ncbi:MAG TPA: phosphoribosyl-AMP cyclohydrolase [bacterium]|jgi:phosphoribosyl-AMP cyclohydrolase|nr:phosphoribosyl-AMP cyclohydrolase [bacterium]HXC63623.1 phosphoribosyl-AMP cyclohydrolase [bacterium]
MDTAWVETLKYDANGLIPALIQDHKDNQILMVAWMNKASLLDTLKTGKTHFWSRSRQKYWMKGEESGNVQNVKQTFYDCDNDVLLFKVEQVGEAACHTGHRSCFYMEVTPEGLKDTGKMVFDPAKVYKK